MTSYQFVIYYRSIKAQRYFKVASIWLGANNAAALDIILGVMCGIICAPADMRSKFEGYGQVIFRHMSDGDVVEVAGKAYVYSDGSFWDIDFQADHQYGNAQGWEFDDLEREQAELETEYKEWAEEQYAINNCLV